MLTCVFERQFCFYSFLGVNIIKKKRCQVFFNVTVIKHNKKTSRAFIMSVSVVGIISYLVQTNRVEERSNSHHLV